MKTLILLFIVSSVGAIEQNTYYDRNGYYEGYSNTVGQHTTYYDRNGYMVGSRTTTSAERPAPTLQLAPIPIPGTYQGITQPYVDIIGDPE